MEDIERDILDEEVNEQVEETEVHPDQEHLEAVRRDQ